MIHLQVTRFAIVSILSFVLGLVWAWFFHEVVGWSPELAVILSIVLVSIQNFILLKYYVYQTQTKRKSSGMLAQFALSVLAFRGLEYLFFLLFHTVMGFHYLATITIIRIVLMIAKFLFYKLTIFKSDVP